MAGFKVGYFVGSLATKSINRLLAKALVRVAPQELQLTEIPFKDLSLYSHDYDKNYPPVATAFKDAIAAVDAVLFVTPDNTLLNPGRTEKSPSTGRSLRPYGTNAFTRKPSAVIGTSPGKIGTAVAQQHLRSILAFCNSPTDECHRSIHSVRGRHDQRGRGGVRQLNERVPPELHGVSSLRFHLTRVLQQCLPAKSP